MADHEEVLVLALGNELFADDAIGILAARQLKERVPSTVRIAEAGGHGLDLLEEIQGFQHVLLLDSVSTGRHEPGTIIELEEKDFAPGGPGSPHASGLPEALLIARKLALPLPGELRVLAMEIRDSPEIRKGLTPAAQGALSAYVARAAEIVNGWLKS